MKFQIIKRTFYGGEIKYIPQNYNEIHKKFEDLYVRYNWCNSRKEALDKIKTYKEMYEYTDEIEEIL
jgi:hypothetical protein